MAGPVPAGVYPNGAGGMATSFLHGIYRRWSGAGAPLLGLSLALFTHAIHNGLAIVSQNICVVAFFDWNGWLFMVGVLLWATH